MLPHALSKYWNNNPWGRTFLVTLVFLVVASALFWLDYFRAYETEVSVLFVTQEEQPAPVVADALGSIMRTLTFATRANEAIEEGTLLPETDSRDVQKSYWNSHLTVTTEEGSGVLTFRQQGETEKAAHDKAVATLKTLMLATNIYYDQNKEVELRVIDQSITRVVVSSWIGYVFACLLSAIVLTSIFFGVLWHLSRKERAARTVNYPEFHIGESVAWIDPQKFVAVKPETLEFSLPKEVSEEEVVVEAPAVPQTRVAIKSGHAPFNLPVMSEALPQFGIEEVDLITEVPELDEEVQVSKEENTSVEEPLLSIVKESEPVDPSREPTVEEYKRRLNELLKGKGF